jgi:hypothetical protein
LLRTLSNSASSFEGASQRNNGANATSSGNNRNSQSYHPRTTSLSRNSPQSPQPGSPPIPSDPITLSEVLDGGHIAPINELYHTTHHYNPYAVREYVRQRKLAPFYTGLEDVDENEVQRVAVSTGTTEEEDRPLGMPVPTDTDMVKTWIARIGGAIECPICFLVCITFSFNCSLCKMISVILTALFQFVFFICCFVVPVLSK